ncbi:MAG: hypothetical protein SGCHY_001777 [Lobulomycetales sp.]
MKTLKSSEEQASLNSLKISIKQKEELVRSKDEEIDRLKYLNEMLSLRLQATQKDLKKSSSIWSLKSFISEPTSNKYVENNLELDTIQRELQAKLLENERLHSAVDDLKSDQSELRTAFGKLKFENAKHSQDVWNYLEDLFGQVVVALHWSRNETPLLVPDSLLREWLNVLDDTLSTQVKYLKLLNLEQSIIPITKADISADFSSQLKTFASSFSIVESYYKEIKRPDFCGSLIQKDIELFSALLSKLISEIDDSFRDTDLYRHHLIQVTLNSSSEKEIHHIIEESPVLKILEKSIPVSALSQDIQMARLLKLRDYGSSIIQIAQAARGFLKVCSTLIKVFQEFLASADAKLATLTDQALSHTPSKTARKLVDQTVQTSNFDVTPSEKDEEAAQLKMELEDCRSRLSEISAIEVGSNFL